MLPSPAPGARILVVDDERVVVLLLEEALRDAGFEVTSAGSIAAAETAMAAGGFDLFLFDKNLPDGSGLDLARRVTNQGLDAEVMLMSGYANLTSAVDAMQCGVADYVIKPFDLADLRARVARALDLRRLKRENRQLIEELRAKNQVLEGLAARDPLTTLFNHAHFQDALQRELARCRRHRLACSLVLVDLDGFREINQQHGHARGDAVLRACGELLGHQGRGSDMVFHLGQHEVAARWGGDTFALLLPETSKSGAAARGNQLRAAIARHDFATVAGLTASIGVAGLPDDASTRDELIQAVQIALGAAKEAGGNRLVSYTPALASQGRLEPGGARIETARLAALEAVISTRSVGYVYQPIVDVEAWTVLAYEALCRPQHPAFESPPQLFAAGERAGQIIRLGCATREVAMRPMAELPAPVLLFLNLHVHELMEPGLLEEDQTLAPWAGRLVLELTEGTDIRDYERVRQRIVDLKQRGFRVAVDDLGSGYSSLNSLALLGPDFVKLDMALIRGIASDSRSSRLIKHVLWYCWEEGLTVIAEGVETNAELAEVQRLGIRHVQGYLLARPGAPFVALGPRATQKPTL